MSGNTERSKNSFTVEEGGKVGASVTGETGVMETSEANNGWRLEIM